MTRLDTSLRPREKLAQRAVHALSNHELLQAMVGSGTRAYPVEYVARKLLKMLRMGKSLPSYEMLLSVEGVGAAQAARIAAAFELSERVRRGALAKVLRPDKYSLPIFYAAYDAGGRLLKESVVESAPPLSEQAVARLLIRELLAVESTAVRLSVRSRESSARPDMRTLALCRKIRESSALLDITILQLTVQTESRELIVL